MELPMAKSARKTSAKTARPRKRAASSGTAPGRPKDVQAALRDSLLRLIAAGGWRDLSYAEIAKDAGVSLAEAYRAYRSKGAILTGISRDLDGRILASLESDPLDGSPKDRLFDLLMRRFDLLNEHRAAYSGLAWELARTPAEGVALLCQLRSSLAHMLEAAGISASGLRGALRIEGLGAIYAAAMRVWFKDESPDLAKTMAELDKRLGQAERWLEMTRRRTA
jgi:AcrR family transcriptional regulator